MAQYSGAKQKHLSNNFTKTETKKNAIILHSTASNADSQFGWFNNPKAGSSSHFHIAEDGTIEQYVDTKYVSWANSAANNRSITIETAGVQAKDEPWTDEQIRAIVKLLVWATKEHGISVRQMESSLATETGIGWHRLGIDGNFPTTGILRGREHRANGKGELWSKSFGKVCPGNLRIQQIPGIITSVKKERSVTTLVKNTITKVVKKVVKSKSWPDVVMPESATTSTIQSAWGKVMKSFKYSGTTDKAMQSWLSNKGYYKGRIDGKFQNLSIKALQSYLKKLGHYSGLIDGSRGPVTRKAEVKFLNTQRNKI